ncbi:MAG: hypothetical protein QOD53_900 [Thermoleophilaceae bacterium]|nr:hypothetical protein [Thermoleophilaceae bacterium]
MRTRRGSLTLAAAALAAALAVPAGVAIGASVKAEPSPARSNDAPHARLSATPGTVLAGSTILLDGSRSRDPDGRVVRYLWDLNGDGNYETGTGSSSKLKDILASPGAVTVGLRVVDDHGAVDDDHVRVRATALSDETLSGGKGGGGETLKSATVKKGKGNGGGGASGRSAPLHAAAATTVSIKDFAFAPTSVTVHVGDTVTWSNQGPTGHSATANDGSFNTGVMKKGGSGSFRFTKAGTFAYHCTPHPNMKATVVVAASSGGSTSSAGSAPSSSASSSPSSSSSPGNGSSSGSSLPHTGLQLGALAVAGLALLGGGMALRRRVAHDDGTEAGG